MLNKLCERHANGWPSESDTRTRSRQALATTKMKIPHTRSFRIHHTKGEFKIFVTQTDLKGFFAGSVLYYDKTRIGSGTATLLHYDLKTFLETNEEAALNECKNWINQNLGENFTAEEIYE